MDDRGWRLYQWEGLDLKVRVGPCTYEPAEDTMLALGSLKGAVSLLQPESLVDIGTGSGILALAAVMLGVPRVVAVDASPWAVRSAAETLSGMATVIRCKWASCLQDSSFDVAVVNPPYLPVGLEDDGECGGWLSMAWSGAPGAVVDACREAARVARRGVVLVYSSLSGVDVEACLGGFGFVVVERREASFFMEKLYSILAVRSVGEA